VSEANQKLIIQHPIAVIGLPKPAAPHNPDVPPFTEYTDMAKVHFRHIDTSVKLAHLLYAHPPPKAA